MRRIILTSVVATTALSLLSGPAHAAPHTDTWHDDAAAPGDTVGLVLHVDDVTLQRALADLSAATSAADAQSALEDSLDSAALAHLAGEVDMPEGALFAGEVQTMAKRSFTQCMKAKVGKDLRSIFNVNAIAALIGREKYLEAAKAAVKYLAKQGIKRNAAGLAATLAYYAARCKLFG
ncbi:MAG: hypothetical protein EON53_11810 [Actinomycetales bacterium]|nr:MAG: hypothetical protein EON53_11810 [Actinomycetales bacterium]